MVYMIILDCICQQFFSMKKNFNLETPGAGLVSGAGTLLVTLVVCYMEANSR